MTRNFKARYNPQIYLDIQKQVDYYRRETSSNELGNRFVQAVETALRVLNPICSTLPDTI